MLQVSVVPPRRSAVLTVFRSATAINDGTTAEPLRNHGDHGDATAVYAVQTAVAPGLRCDGGITIDHLYKLKYYGLNDAALCRNYIINRKQYAEIANIKSEENVITTGVPQGSILGPLLFIIYNNDIALSSDMFQFVIYADDTTITSRPCTLNTFKDQGGRIQDNQINNELNKINCWLKATNFH